MLYASIRLILNALGVETHIEYDEPVVRHYGRGVEEEVSDSVTPAGMFAMMLSAMIGARLGMALYHRELSGGLDDRQRVEFRAWFVGFVTMAAVDSVLSLARGHFDDDWYVDYGFAILLLAAAVGTFFFIKKWRDEKLRRLLPPNG